MADPEKTSDEQYLSPEEALRLLEQHARAEQDQLAGRTDAGSDVLHYLAQNGASATRRAVAANPAAAPKTNRYLADDDDQNVRSELARKIGQLFPGLLQVEQQQLRDLTLQTLERLVQDEVTAVRAIIADEIKHHTCVPKKIIKQLANDREPSVCVPVIEHSPLLEDRDLIAIVAAGRASAVLSAVARRKKLSEDVSDAVAATLDIDAVSNLLANTDATIRAKTLDRIISNAAEVAEWHGSLVVRAELSQSSIRRLAKFVASVLIDSLASRGELDDSTRKHLKKRYADKKKAEVKSEAAQFEAARKAGKLDEAFVAEAVDDCRKDTIVKALALLAKTDEETVRRILDSRSSRAAVALVWRAGLSMRVAFKLQTQVMRLSGPDLLPARGGIDFPMPEDQMRWHLSYFGLS